MARPTSLLLTAALALAGCGLEPPPAGPLIPTFEDGPVPFEQPVRVSYGRDLEPAEYVFTQEADWRSFWADLSAGEPPEVDFTHQQIVGASLGEGSDGCFRLDFESMTARDGVVEVVISGTHHPCCGCLCTLMLTRPFIAAAVPRRAASFEFSWIDTTVTCNGE